MNLGKNCGALVRTIRTAMGLATIAAGLAASATEAEAGAREVATRLFDRLASAPLSLKDPRRAQMEQLITAGNLLGAAQIATADDRFYNLTVRTWATPMSNRAEEWQVAQRSNELHRLTDFIAMIIGTVRDDRSAQELLNGDFTYAVTEAITNVVPFKPIDADYNRHYQSLEDNKVNLRQKLVRITPQRIDMSDAAGVLTSQHWGHEHYVDGTNRRPLHYALREFLCTDISELRDAAYPTTRIRRDVDRAPGGDATVFNTTCKTCHGGMDGLAGAFAYYNTGYINDENAQFNIPAPPPGYFAGQQLMRFPNAFDPNTKVVYKMNQNSYVYPAGYATTDDSWVNYFAMSTTAKNKELGWNQTMLSGNGVRSLGTMLASARGFPVCMAKRVYRKVCAKTPTAAEDATINSLADKFVASGFKLKSLFENAAILPECAGN
jgi:hypothetical protein